MLDYIWSISDEALRDGRNQPPKPECPSGSATYAFACVCAITKTTRRARATERSGDCKARRKEGSAAFASRTFKASRSRPVSDMAFRTAADPSRRPGLGVALSFPLSETSHDLPRPRADYPEISSGRERQSADYSKVFKWRSAQTFQGDIGACRSEAAASLVGRTTAPAGRGLAKFEKQNPRYPPHEQSRNVL